MGLYKTSSFAHLITASSTRSDPHLIMSLHLLRFLCITTIFVAPLSQVYAVTNEELLKERLISPTVYELLNKNKANTIEERSDVIRKACSAGQLSKSDCGDGFRPRYR